MHSTIPPPAQAGPSGIPEAGSNHFPPDSPPLAAYAASRTRRGAAAHHIKSECVRFCCDTLKAIFLGEGKRAIQDSLVLDAQDYSGNIERGEYNGGYLLDSDVALLSSSERSVDGLGETNGSAFVESYMEVWEYVGGSRFRGFVAERNGQRAMFVFFDREAFGNELKSGLMALLELCSSSDIHCSQLNLCLDRRFKPGDRTTLMRDLAWVGFEAITLEEWTDQGEIISERWIFLGMET